MQLALPTWLDGLKADTDTYAGISKPVYVLTLALAYDILRPIGYASNWHLINH